MAEIVIMPKLGFNMSEGKLVRWYKRENDKIKKGEPFFAVETDKTNIDVEATIDGVVKKILINEGESVEVTRPIAIIGEENENIDDLLPKEVSVSAGNLGNSNDEQDCIEIEEKREETQSTTGGANGKVRITPRARKMAIDNGLDIESLQIKGTGFQGGICEKDIVMYMEEQQTFASPLARKLAEMEKIDLSTVSGSGARGKVLKADIEAKIEGRGESLQNTVINEQMSPDGKVTLKSISYTGVRKIIGDRLSQSKFTAPHLYFTHSVDLTKLLELRKKINEYQEKKTSITDYIVLAIAKALQKYPEMNSSLVANEIVQYKSVNVGVAVAADSGLIVPVVKNTENMGLIDISNETSRLVEKARKGKLLPEEYSGGTFTVSNLGMYGIKNFTAIINPPEVGILAVSAMEKTPKVITNEKGIDEIAIRPTMNVTLSVDHRIIDGLIAAQFIGYVKNLLEDTVKLLI